MIKIGTFEESDHKFLAAEFGLGLIEMVCSKKSKEDEEVILAFKSSKEPHPVNTDFPMDYEDFEEMKPEIIFVFKKEEGIDAVIDMLKRCKEEFNKPKII